MNQNLFITGFPGFLAYELIRRVLKENPTFKATCLVQSKFKPLALEQVQSLVSENGALKDRISLVEGDITLANLGLPASFSVDFHQVFHLAAVYDLSIARDIAMRINLEGTKNVLTWVRSLKNHPRFHYVSTCYVSGKYAGKFTERDLQKGQSFNNFYEETKFLAEVEVQKAMQEGLTTTIYRPAVVMGDSETGVTQKFDGPYYVIQWLLRQPKHALLPKIGKPEKFQINVVPSDFVCEALARLSQSEETKNRVFQLADPHALTVEAFVKDIASKTERKLLQFPVSLGLAKFALNSIPGVESMMKIPADALNYFVHPTIYGTEETEPFTRNVGVVCPRFPTYSAKLIQFMKNHPSLRTSALR